MEESGIQILKKEFKTFIRRRKIHPPPLPLPLPLPSPSPSPLPSPSPSLSSSSSVPVNPTLSISPQTSTPAEEIPSPTFKKKTRDLPNFSECHACGFRVDSVDGRSRLNSLYSEWRIVLLCKKCFSLVESSRVCSYCFSESVGDCFSCCECNHRVHRECFSQFRGVAPWSYSNSGSEFSVCIDCWVPKPIVTARAVLKSRKIRRKGILDSDLRSSKVSLSDVVKDANYLVEKKIDAAVRARQLALKKAAVARRAAEFASHALNLVAQRDENVAKESGEIADDVELAIQLHRAMNSSPRFSKNLCSVNSHYMAFQNMKVDGDPSDGPPYPVDFNFFKTPEDLVENNLCGCPDNTGSQPSFTAKDHVSPLDINHSDSDGCKDPTEGIVCSIKCEIEPGNAELPLNEGYGSSSIRLMTSGCGDSGLYTESQVSHKQDKYALPSDERCIPKPYHYFLKYRRRDTTKRYLLKYSKRNPRLKRLPDCRPDILVDGVCLGVQSSSVGNLSNGCEEFPAISNASCAVPLQSSGCECSSKDQ